MVSDWSESWSSSSSMASLAMVTEELEAAEALADLAMFSRLPPERTIRHPQPPETACPSVPIEPSSNETDPSETNLNNEKDTKVPNTLFVGSTGCSALGSGKSRRNLTETEKEERRIRRVLANRESARQTIRRRQALCEELTKKAADLTSENASLKREMEMALNEYQMLESTNKELRDQMTTVASAEADEITHGLKPASVHVTPMSASPLFLYNHPPYTPLFWPPVSQSQNSIQVPHLPQNIVLVPSNGPFPVEACRESCEQENVVNTNPLNPPFHIIPYPWFFPHNDHRTAIQSQPSSFQNNEQEGTSGAASCLETTPHFLFPIKVKAEPFGSHESRIPNDLNEPPDGFPHDEGDQLMRSYLDKRIPDEPSSDMSPVKCLKDIDTIKNENGCQLEFTSRLETASEVFHSALVPQEKCCEQIMYSYTKSAEAVASAEARKRRKELTKLKSLHSRQCRMHC